MTIILCVETLVSICGIRIPIEAVIRDHMVSHGVTNQNLGSPNHGMARKIYTLPMPNFCGVSARNIDSHTSNIAKVSRTILPAYRMDDHDGASLF